jgi:hypothetical protein
MHICAQEVMAALGSITLIRYGVPYVYARVCIICRRVRSALSAGEN